MNSNTEVLPELDEQLDFDVICEAEKECGAVAKWMGIAPRCPHAPFLCETHRSIAVTLSHAHLKVACAIDNCGVQFCLCEVTWRHL